MVKLIVIFCMLSSVGLVQAQSSFLSQTQMTEDQRTTVSPQCIKNTPKNRSLIEGAGIRIKYETKDYLFISAATSEIERIFLENPSQLIFDNSQPHLLNDTARMVHKSDLVHQGTGLSSGYTGKGVVIGYVDTGVDYLHPDFMDENGKTRVIRYWDHSMSSGGLIHPDYGYGVLWDSTAINNGSCTSSDEHSHGTTVAGAGSGNGLATGYNQGHAPNSSIVIVETNFGLPNWTLTIADAVDYVFNVADSLGLPAVVNLSLGTYYGSHDGNDPAAEAIETLLDEKGGRIVVSACGNSGAFGKYHARGEMIADTNFVWIQNNPSSSFGANKVFFDLWSDVSDAGYSYSFSAIDPNNNYSKEGQTVFRSALFSVGTPIFDTIWNGSNRLAVIEVYPNIIGSNLNIQILATMDSTSYHLGFNTANPGIYDLWTSTVFGHNNLVTSIPDVATYPSIVNYIMPDSLQTIVSSWNCSEKVISVGNVRNRLRFWNFEDAWYYPADLTTPGKLSPNSSKGPNRHLVLKPDIAANGDITLSAGPLWYLANPAHFIKMDSGGWHMSNGGTSMACPVISGIAALYLERCSKATYADFKADLMGNAFGNAYSGVLPNYGFGAGLADAHAMLLNSVLDTAQIDPISMNGSLLSTSSTAGNYQWTLEGNDVSGATNSSYTVPFPGGFYSCYSTHPTTGCRGYAPVVNVILGIDELLDESFVIYPNPTTTLIYLESTIGIKQWSLLSMDGKLLRAGDEATIDVSELSNGSYLIQLDTEFGLIEKMVIKQ